MSLAIYLELERMGFKCWYDNRAKDLTKEVVTCPLRSDDAQHWCYERDALLKAVIGKAGFEHLVNETLAEKTTKQLLAKMPEDLSHVDLENYRDRPVQEDLVAKLLLTKDDPAFTSCVLVHGMGGAGKTATIVAVLQMPVLRTFYSDIFWLAVGADALSNQLKKLQAALYKQMTGKSISNEEASAKSNQEWQQMLTEGLVEKQRALVVLDDPWMPEQVRALNPIDGSQSTHRLLISTRIRDLVPKATRVELPLMSQDEAVALLLELANVEEATYLKAQLGASCEELGKRHGGAASGPLSVQDRVIGAGLKALDKQADGAALKELFYMFAVTQEDFVHPMAVIELLWKSCCASDAEAQEGRLTARLKVRQRTQLLVDHSLLLGSSSEGIHLHDIVLQYLRKRLSAEEMRAEHLKVVEGMVAAAAERVEVTGRGFQDTGAVPFKGEEVDWYCCCMGSWHFAAALDPSTPAAESKKMREWLMLSDEVLCHQATITVGEEGLEAIAKEYVANGAHFSAAKAKFGLFLLRSGDREVGSVLMKEALTLLEQCEPLTLEGQQLEYDIIGRYTWFLNTNRGNISDDAATEAEKSRIKARAEKAKQNPDLRKDPFSTYLTYSPELIYKFANVPHAWAGGRTYTDDDMSAALVWNREVLLHLQTAARDQVVGARREYYQLVRTMGCIPGCGINPCHHSQRNAQLTHAITADVWGEGSQEIVDAVRTNSFARHHVIARKSPLQYK
eukprot:g2185.t1